MPWCTRWLNKVAVYVFAEIRGQTSLTLTNEGGKMGSEAMAVKEKRVNGVNVYELHDTIKALRENPGLGRACFRASNQWKGQALNETQIGKFYCAGEERTHKTKFVFQNDEAHALLGNDEAANPVEFILHALAGCVTTTTVYHAAARGIGDYLGGGPRSAWADADRSCSSQRLSGNPGPYED